VFKNIDDPIFIEIAKRKKKEKKPLLEICRALELGVTGNPFLRILKSLLLSSARGNDNWSNKSALYGRNIQWLRQLNHLPDC
jgi:hypothetical protein